MGDTEVGTKRKPTTDGRNGNGKKMNLEGVGSNKIGTNYMSLVPSSKNDKVQVFNAIPYELIIDQNLRLFGEVKDQWLKQRGIGIVPTNFLGAVVMLRHMALTYGGKVKSLPKPEAEALIQAIRNYHYFVKMGRVTVDGRVRAGDTVMGNSGGKPYSEDSGKIQWEYWWNFVETPYIMHRCMLPLGVMYGEESPYGFDQKSIISSKGARATESNRQLINLTGDWYMRNLVSPRKTYEEKASPKKKILLSHFFQFQGKGITTMYYEQYPGTDPTHNITINGIRLVPVNESYVGELCDLFSVEKQDYTWAYYHPICHNRGVPRELPTKDVVDTLERAVNNESMDPYKTEDGEVARAIIECQRDLSDPYTVDILTN